MKNSKKININQIKKELKKEKSPLKPIILIDSTKNFYRPNFFKQNLLLKALTITTDPNKLKKMAHLRTVAEVYRTLDKLAMRREYHEALARHGISFDYLIENLKKVIDGAKHDKDKLTGIQIILKSIGMDNYKEQGEDNKKGWEELLVDASQNEKMRKKVIDGEIIEYDVKVPEIPEEEKRKIEEEGEIGKSLYD